MKDSVSRILLRQAAIAKGYGVSEAGDDEYFLEITHPSGRMVCFRGTLNNRNSSIGSLVSRRKDLTLQFVEKHIASVPAYVKYHPSTANDFLAEHGTVAVKPIDGAQSKGVSLNITTPAQLAEAVKFAEAHSYRGQVLLQKQLSGKLYRLLVVNGKLEAAALREAPVVIGDGKSTVRQLIDLLNQDPRRSKEADSPLKPVSIDDAEKYLEPGQMESVVGADDKVRVCALDSVSAGGQATDVTDAVHPRHAKIAERLADQLDLYVCGYDIICDNIAEEPADKYWPLLEINSGPGLKLHQYPTGGGQPRNPAETIIEHLFDDIAKT